MSTTLEVLASQLNSIEKNLKEMNETIHKVRNLVIEDRTMLTRLDERYVFQTEAIKRAFDQIGQIKTQVDVLNAQQPVTKLVTGWVIAGVISVASMGFVQIWTVNKNAERPVMVVDKEVVERWKNQ